MPLLQPTRMQAAAYPASRASSGNMPVPVQPGKVKSPCGQTSVAQPSSSHAGPDLQMLPSSKQHKGYCFLPLTWWPGFQRQTLPQPKHRCPAEGRPPASALYPVPGKGRWVCVIDSLRVAKGAIADRALVAVAVEVHSWRLGAGGCPGLLPADDGDERCWQRGMPPDVPAATLGDKPRGRQTKQQCSR